MTTTNTVADNTTTLQDGRVLGGHGPVGDDADALQAEHPLGQDSAGQQFAKQDAGDRQGRDHRVLRNVMPEGPTPGGTLGPRHRHERLGQHDVDVAHQDLGERCRDRDGDGCDRQRQPFPRARIDHRDQLQAEGEDLDQHDAEPEHRDRHEDRGHRLEGSAQPGEMREGREHDDHGCQRHRGQEESAASVIVGGRLLSRTSVTARPRRSIAEPAGQEIAERVQVLKIDRAVRAVGRLEVGSCSGLSPNSGFMNLIRMASPATPGAG